MFLLPHSHAVIAFKWKEKKKENQLDFSLADVFDSLYSRFTVSVDEYEKACFTPISPAI